METHRKGWNKRQTELRKILTSFEQHEKAVQLFLSQHASLHTAQMAGTEPWSFEDWVMNGMSEEDIRRIPPGEDHSVAWLIWHLARIEDVAMNMLVANEDQRLHQDEWYKRMKATAQDTGNAISAEGVSNLSAMIDIGELRAYRFAVGRRTREIVLQLEPEDLKRKVNPAHLQQVLDKGAVVKQAQGLIDYWSKRDVAGLLLMPPTRHGFVHLNEALRIKRKRS
jgi:hypothetical protein